MKKDRPEWIPKDVNQRMFVGTRLTSYYEQESGHGNTLPTEYFKKALDGELGEKHQEAATYIKDLSKEVFEKTNGKEATMFRAGSAHGGMLSVSESKGGAFSATANVNTGAEIKPTIVTSDEVMFSWRTIASPYGSMEREVVIDKSYAKKGGAGSGNFNHESVPGHRGGSAPSGGGVGIDQKVKDSMGWAWTDGRGREIAYQTEIDKNLSGLAHTTALMVQHNADIREWFTGGTYGNTQSFLRDPTYIARTGDWKNGAFNATIASIDGGFDNVEALPEGVDLYRGVGPEHGRIVAAMDIGDTCTDMGYAATSLDPTIAKAFSINWAEKKGDPPSKESERTIIRVLTDGKIKGMYYNGGAMTEVLLPRGTTMKVIGKEVVSAKAWTGITTNTHFITMIPVSK
jgi:hypothetical protein